jgi:hypothetical protein
MALITRSPLALMVYCHRGDGMDYLSKAQRYREQAVNLRALAVKDEKPQTREALLAVARDYDCEAAMLLNRTELRSREDGKTDEDAAAECRSTTHPR